MTTLSLSNRGRLSGPTTAVLAFFFSLLPLSFLPLATGEVGGGLRPSPVATSLQSQRRLQQRALSAAGARRDGGTGQDRSGCRMQDSLYAVKTARKFQMNLNERVPHTSNEGTHEELSVL